MKKFNNIGLVLKGGCQEGAYQAGVIVALAERNIEVNVLSAEGVGALNAGIVASAENMKQAAQRLAKVWEVLGEETERTANVPALIKYGLSAGNRINYSKTGLRVLTRIGKRFQVNLGIDPMHGQLEDDTLAKILTEYLTEEGLANGIPLHVMTFKTRSRLYAGLMALTSATKCVPTPPQCAISVTGMEPALKKSFILASAAAPLLFKSFHYNGAYHFDGRVGSAKEKNIQKPLYATLLRDNCDLIIAPFCEDALSVPGVAFIAVNPTKPMARSYGLLGAVKNYLGVRPDVIELWVRQGYCDTMAVLDNEEKKGVLFAPDENGPKTDLDGQPYYKAVHQVETEISEEKN